MMEIARSIYDRGKHKSLEVNKSSDVQLRGESTTGSLKMETRCWERRKMKVVG